MATHRTAIRLPMLTATIAMIIGLIPAAPATAHPGTAEGIVGTADLSVFPCSGPSACSGTFSGTTALLVAGTSVGVSVPTSATFAYTDDCVSGTASGTITFSGGLANESLRFAWTRVGEDIVLLFDGAHSGAGNAKFVPSSDVTVCATGGVTSLTASVAGSGRWLDSL